MAGNLQLYSFLKKEPPILQNTIRRLLLTELSFLEKQSINLRSIHQQLFSFFCKCEANVKQIEASEFLIILHTLGHDKLIFCLVNNYENSLMLIFSSYITICSQALKIIIYHSNKVISFNLFCVCVCLFSAIAALIALKQNFINETFRLVLSTDPFLNRMI